MSTAPATTESPDQVSAARTFWVYCALVLVPVALYSLILYYGQQLPNPVGVLAPLSRTQAPLDATLQLPIFLRQIVVVVVVARFLGRVVRRLGQPQVVGEMLAGLALGPSLLGLVWPAGFEWLFPVGTVRFLNALSQIGLVLFMFLVGLELDIEQIRARGREVLVISHAGIALPLLGGGAVALALYQRYSTPAIHFPIFALFLGCAMSVTAFPVLARILADRGLVSTPFGVTAMACAAVADVTAWGMLAVIVALAQGATDPFTLLGRTLLGLLLFLVIMTIPVRRIGATLWQKARAINGTISQDMLASVVLLILISALVTEVLHIHAIFGAFIAGLVMPQDHALRTAIRTRLEDLLVVLLLPLFFAFTGLRTNVGLLRSPMDLFLCLVVTVVAVVGKLGGTVIAARWQGSNWQAAGAMGVLMNSRGLMELVLLTIGLQYGIITPALFTMMVIMAIVTTMMTTPLMSWLVPKDTETSGS